MSYNLAMLLWFCAAPAIVLGPGCLLDVTLRRRLDRSGLSDAGFKVLYGSLLWFGLVAFIGGIVLISEHFAK